MKRRKRITRAERQRRRHEKRRRRQGRDYKREYQRRIRRGLARGLTKSQARGHAPITTNETRPLFYNPNNPRERAILRMKRGASIKAAAKAERISSEHLSIYVKEHVSATWTGRRWKIVDRRGEEMAICTRGKVRWVRILAGAEATAIGQYWVAVNRFLRTNDPAHLTPFVGKGVKDINGKYFPLTTEPNVLRRLESAGELSFPEIYKCGLKGARYGRL
jgi:hypothetical protein